MSEMLKAKFIAYPRFPSQIDKIDLKTVRGNNYSKRIKKTIKAC